MNNKVKFLRGTSNEYAVAEKDSDTIYFTTDDGKLYIGDKEVSGSDVTIDDTLSDTSTNPVQNKVIKQAIDNKADSSHTHVKADITDFPASLPANGGNADTVNGLHASDFMPYIGVVDDLFAVNKTCICAYGQNTLNTPLKAGLTMSGSGLCFVNLTSGAEWANYIVMAAGDEYLYSATSKNGVLNSEWRRINDRNADTVGGFKIKVTHIAGSTDQYGNLLLWTVVDNKRPFLVIINGHYAIPFLMADSNDFYFYASVIDYTNHSSVPNISISADVYYLE